METAVKRLYEAMFLVDSAQASDWDSLESTIKKILKKAKAEIVSIGNWSERKLAYEINSKSRGTYILCYFRAEGEKIPEIEKAVQLSEQIMRVLILSAENREKEAMAGVTAAAVPDPEPHEAGDKPDVSEAEDKTAPPHEEDDFSEQAEGEQGESDFEADEDISTEPKTAEADEPEQPAKTESADASKPE